MGEACYGDLGIEVAASGGSRRLYRPVRVPLGGSRVGVGMDAAVIVTPIAVPTIAPAEAGAWSGVGRSRVAAAGWQIEPCRIMALDPGSARIAVAARVADAIV